MIDNVVVHANAENIQHAGAIVGVSVDSASAGNNVKIQLAGLYTSSLFTFPRNGKVYVQHDGTLGLTPLPTSAFIQVVGYAVGPQTIYIDIDRTVITV